ncbi:WXG100 family type VII secretion target [Micromonospora endolithica]|uniref:WXG100 family type VII secretion target n=1 Tax=Micromonospora endolithica TaxID=230091 RepID=A0A3A9YYI7_9ACTN|nr:WXG100 family type VII secretion target [Micromonospora endolithica]RKN41151.1 WXG100 family type VII secretion target [Micromonospora endolithica]TWJ24364.1 uncharacterized protein YukE [Micromonospora endolithica]
MSDYVPKYQPVSHQALYDGVMAGEPGQIDGVAADWSALKGVVEDLGRQLNADLAKLANTWTGEAGREFQGRMAHIVAYTESLGSGMAYVGRGLTMMADDLRQARARAESPEATDDNDQMWSGAGKGAIFGLGGAVVGGFLGHQQDKAEQEKAHQRMVKVVADLAAGYDLSAYDHLLPPPPPDPETPGGVGRTASTPLSGPGADTPTGAPASSGGTPRTGGLTVAAPDRPADGPGGSTGTNTGIGPAAPGTGGSGGSGTGAAGPAPVGGVNTGTSLAGADPLVGGALLGGVAAGALGLGQPGTATTVPAGTGAGLSFGPPVGTPAGGVVRGSALAGSTGGTPGPATRPATGAAPVDSRSATGVGRGLDGRRLDGAGRDAATARQGMAGNRLTAGDRTATGGASGGPAAGGNRGVPGGGPGSRPGVLGAGRGVPAGDEQTGSHLTWLTEDDIVWRGDEQAAPPVLGG